MRGHLEVISGCMFSGKSEELIRRLRRATFAKQRLQVFKPGMDTRYHAAHVASHAKSQFPATPIEQPEEILGLLDEGVEIVGIDEAQFMAPGLVEVVEALVDYRSIRVIVAGLNQTSTGKPFGPMPQLMAMADEVTILSAVCTVCGEAATKSMKLVASGSLVEVGEADKYEARCRAHFSPTR